ncbi:helix-turn-helix domain-containing protein [Enterococcus sp. LJL90]
MNLTEQRKKRHLTQNDLAQKLNISRQSISKWETGEATPTIENIIRLSQLFEISIDELLTGLPYLELPFFVGRKGSKRILVGPIIWGLLAAVFALMTSENLGLALLVFLIIFSFVLFLCYPPTFNQHYNYWQLDKQSITYLQANSFSENCRHILAILFSKEAKLEKKLALAEIQAVTICYQKRPLQPEQTLYYGFVAYLFKSFQEPFYLQLLLNSGEKVILDLRLDYTLSKNSYKHLNSLMNFFKQKGITINDPYQLIHADKKQSLQQYFYAD